MIWFLITLTLSIKLYLITIIKHQQVVQTGVVRSHSGAKKRPRPKQTSSGPSNFLSDFFGSIFNSGSNRRSNVPKVLPKQIRRPIPMKDPRQSNRVFASSSENPKYRHPSVDDRSDDFDDLLYKAKEFASYNSRLHPGARPKIDKELFAKKPSGKDRIRVGGGGYILPSDPTMIGGGGISLAKKLAENKDRKKRPGYPSYVSLEQ